MLVWTVGITVYVVAILHRTTFGIAGVEATERFGVSASALGSFVVLQLSVYAVLQIPAGALVDRFGPRRVIVVGAVVMAVGQTILALTMSVPLAALGRVCVGAGDAVSFVSVLRLAAAWYPPRRVPLMSQLIDLFGQAGHLLSAIPFAVALYRFGWSAAFLSVAALGMAVAMLAASMLRDSPDGQDKRPARRQREGGGRAVAEAWRDPGTRLGFWTHFSTTFTGLVFVLQWGAPFLVAGQGISVSVVGVMLAVRAITTACAGPVVGTVVGRFPQRRSQLVFGIVVANVLAWTAVLAWPGRCPLWLLVLLMLALGTCGPAAIVGFDFARTSNPPHRFGTASGIVNVGGFAASLLTILAVGFVLDVLSDGEARYELGDFKIAFCVQYIVWAVGIVGILRAARAARRRGIPEDGERGSGRARTSPED